MWLWIIVAVVVVLAIIAIVAMANKKRTQQQRSQAETLRTEANTQAGGLTESQRAAEEARAQAELAKAEADRAAERAAAAEQGHQVEQASYEDKLRAADQVDPDVNTKSAEYEPSVWSDGTTSAPTSDDGAVGSHRAGAETTTSPEEATTVSETPTERPSTPQ